MNTLRIGDIVIGNNSWLNTMLGYGGECGIIVCSGPYSSVIRIFTIEEDITLMNDYIENLNIKKDYNSFRIGDLVVIKSKLSRFLTIKGVGIILEKTK